MDMPGPPPEHQRIKPSSYALSDYARNHPDYLSSHPTATPSMGLDSPKEPNGPGVNWTSYSPPTVSLCQLPPDGALKRLVPTGLDYTFKPGTKFDQDGLPIPEVQSRVDIISKRHGGVPVQPRPWEMKTISNSKGIQGSNSTLSSFDSRDDITLVSSRSSGSFTPLKDRPNMVRYEPMATIHPAFHEGGPESAVYRTNFDLNTENDPFEHGKAYWGKFYTHFLPRISLN